MRGPGISRDFVFAPARVAAGLRLHFEQHEIAEAALVQAPRRAQAGHAAADNHDRNAQLLRRRAKRRAIAQPVAQRKRIVDEPAGDRAIGFAPQADERRRAEEFARDGLDHSVRDVLPFLFVIADQNLVVQSIRLGRHRLHVHRKYEQLARRWRSKGIAARTAIARGGS